MKAIVRLRLAAVWVGAILSCVDSFELSGAELRVETNQQAVVSELEQLAQKVPGTVGYAVVGRDGALLLANNAEELFPQASAIKVPLLMEVIAQREEGKVDWRQSFRINRANQVAGSGVLLDFSDGGSSLCVADLCTLMIVVSDNTATNLLIDLVGMEAVNGRLNELGCPQTRLRRVMMDMEASRRGEENVSTPAEAAKIMAILARGEFYCAQVSEEVLNILRKPKSTAIRKAVPAEIPVASKPGGIPGVSTEWAWVSDPQHPYAIALMGKNGDEEKFRGVFTELAKRIHEAVTKE